MSNNNEILLFFGSFNPIHIGHMAIANYLTEFCDIHELWFVITPQNPTKKASTLLKDRDRQYLTQLAIEDYPKFRVSDIEFYLPKPNYTINTLTYLKEKYPDVNFSILMGGDNLESLHKWKNYRIILDNYKIYVYKRPCSELPEFENANINIIDAPQMEISSSFIRNAIKNNKDIRYFLPPKVYEYIMKMGWWK
ncbi:MAG: nicotinate (nicotinamide) nucleotide adenylyltransferase [Bacteroidales bacterium]|nr:nicotinate (nicotinamide) nucleotide adenylyltransferase [Bacteroidales bacterium]MDY0143058.1 nicotinate (nicotinamide) nucleotide adenylyltransferase [Bacteroidales bacterium]